MFRQDLRHINTNSDSEVLLNVFAHELELAPRARNSTRTLSLPRSRTFTGAAAGPMPWWP